jgi:Flp pilus assembly protein TadB
MRWTKSRHKKGTGVSATRLWEAEKKDGSSLMWFSAEAAVMIASSRGLGFSEAVFIWILVGLIIIILVTPLLYYRSLRKRKQEKTLRQFLMQDERLRQSLQEHYRKKSNSKPPPENTAL